MADKHTVAITGGDTPLGRRLTRLLRMRGHRVVWYTSGRQHKSDLSDATYTYNIERMWIDPRGLEEADTLIHLAGTNPWGFRWNKDRKYEMLRSRVYPLALMERALRDAPARPKRLIVASSVAYYGAITDRDPLGEQAPEGRDFLARMYGYVEQLSRSIAGRLDLDLTVLREGVPLYRSGGAFRFWSSVVGKGINTPIGDGHQWMNWIHLEDLCQIYLALVEGQISSGLYNAVAPSPVTNEQFMYALSNLKGDWIPKWRIPKWLVQLGMGEASTMLMEGSPVDASQLLLRGYEFRFPTLGRALRQLSTK